jgi:hypothetical protein
MSILQFVIIKVKRWICRGMLHLGEIYWGVNRTAPHGGVGTRRKDASVSISPLKLVIPSEARNLLFLPPANKSRFLASLGMTRQILRFFFTELCARDGDLRAENVFIGAE